MTTPDELPGPPLKRQIACRTPDAPLDSGSGAAFPGHKPDKQGSPEP